MPVSNHRSVYHLPARMSAADRLALQDFLRLQYDEPVMVSAHFLFMLDTLTLQLLIAAAKSWMARGLGFEVTDVSPEISKVMNLIGVQPQMLIWKEAQ